MNRRISAIRFRYGRCTVCGLLSLRNAPQDLGSYYPPEYYGIARSVDELAAWARLERYKLDLVQQFCSTGRLLEIGPASGAFCYLAKDAGFNVTAIEMDHRSCVFLTDVLGIEAIESADEAKALASARPADVIAMWHVIEHLVDPWSMLEVAARKLQPGGVLILATPNPHATQFAVLGRRWAHIDAPRHLWLFPPSVIAERGRRLGLIVRMVTTRDAGSLGWNRFGWEYSLRGLASGPKRRKLAGALGRIVAALASGIDSREGRGAAYTIVLQRPAE